MSQSLVNEGRFPPDDTTGEMLRNLASQSLVNEGRFPLREVDLVRRIADLVAIPR